MEAHFSMRINLSVSWAFEEGLSQLSEVSTKCKISVSIRVNIKLEQSYDINCSR